jgi:hypothetical protein
MGGQVSVFIIVPLLGMLVLYSRGHLVAAAGLLAVAVSFKFYPIIFLALFAARRDTRFLLFAAAACGVAVLVVPGLLLGGGDTLGFYGALLDAFRDSGWGVTNPHSQFLPHVVFRFASATGPDSNALLSVLHGITFFIAAVNMGLLFLVQRTRLPHADLWGFQLVFLTIPFVLKTSWPHDFMFLPLTQAFLAWRLLEGDSAWQERTPRARTAVTFFLVISIALSNIVFFNLFGFVLYGFLAFLFWANLLLLIASYVALLPPALRRLRAPMTTAAWPRQRQ